MKIDTEYFHDLCINILYGSLAVLAFVILERLTYYMLLSYRMNKLGAALRRPEDRKLERTFSRRDLPTRSLLEYITILGKTGVTRERIEDASLALAIKVNSRIEARIWLLDTIVTSAPLLGLLGTILGIMDTFAALSSSGVSDPAAVSRGIAAALLATAIGIGTALLALIGLNITRRIADHLTERFRVLILEAHGVDAASIERVRQISEPQAANVSAAMAEA